MAWSRLIRFVDESGRTTFGDPCINNSNELKELLELEELYAVRLAGGDPFSLTRTEEKVKVQRLLGVLEAGDVPIFKCIGYALTILMDSTTY